MKENETLPDGKALGITERVPLFHLWNIWDSPYEGLETLRDQLEEVDDGTWKEYATQIANKIDELIVDGSMVEWFETSLTKFPRDAKYMLTWTSDEADATCWLAISSHATPEDIKWLRSIFDF